jgi:hypothetical protein
MAAQAEAAGFFPEGLTTAGDLVSRGRRRRWRKGGVLCSQEESSRWIAVLLSGIVKASVYTEDGGEVLLGLHGPGALLGELEALDGKPRPATLIALEPVEAAVISHQELMTFMRDDSHAMWLVASTLTAGPTPSRRAGGPGFHTVLHPRMCDPAQIGHDG